jgi:K+-transporting ATPase A subunit
MMSGGFNRDPADGIFDSGFSGWAALTPWGQAGTNNSGPHGLSEIFYAYSSCTGNNGSAFAGLTANPANGDPTTILPWPSQ